MDANDGSSGGGTARLFGNMLNQKIRRGSKMPKNKHKSHPSPWIGIKPISGSY